MFSRLQLGPLLLLAAALAGCGPDYSPNTYSTAAVQQANKVDQGTVAGFREVAIKADGTIGAVTGGAAGGVLGAQAPDGGVVTALSAIGGTFIGGLVGSTVDRAANDTTAFEYIVRKTNGELVSVTQKDQSPLALGLKVLVIEGKQARVVPDYSVPLETPAPSAAGATAKSETKSAKSAATDGPAKTDLDKTGTGPAAADIAPTPASVNADSAPAASAPQAAAQTAPVPAADPQPLPADQGGSTAPAQPPPSDGPAPP